MATIGRPRAPAKMIAEAMRLIDSGVSAADAARQVAKRFKRSCSRAAVQRWAKEAAALELEDDAPPSEPTPAPVAAALEAPAPDEPDTDDLVAQTRKMLNHARKLSKQAEADGNMAAAQKSQRDALNFTGILARLEKDLKSGIDGEIYTAEQIAAADQEIDERVERLAADLHRTGGAVCTRCGVELRILIAKGEL